MGPFLARTGIVAIHSPRGRNRGAADTDWGRWNPDGKAGLDPKKTSLAPTFRDAAIALELWSAI